MPWVSKNSLSFVAEQVSHHPPGKIEIYLSASLSISILLLFIIICCILNIIINIVSAFYSEHYNKKISFCGHIWTKSKFLGLSIGVHNIGQGKSLNR